MTKETLLINDAFALRQHNGKPVYTEIKTKERQYTEQEIIESINNLNEQRREKGFTIVDDFDAAYKKILNSTSKRNRVKTDNPIDLYRVQRIILTPNAKGYISTYFIDFAKEHSIPIYWIDEKGTVDASFMPFNFNKASLIVKQVEARNNGKGLEISKYLIKLKIESEDMKSYLPKLNKAKDIKEVMEVEALASANYFKKWKFNIEWNFSGRHGRALNKFAVDPINAMLNLGYGLLAQRMSEILLKRGFELSIGFLHAYDATATWNRLTYDFIEPYRTWIDIKVFELIQGLRIKPDGFKFNEDKSSMILREDAFAIAIEEFMDALKLLEHKSLPMIRIVESMI